MSKTSKKGKERYSFCILENISIRLDFLVYYFCFEKEFITPTKSQKTSEGFSTLQLSFLLFINFTCFLISIFSISASLGLSEKLWKYLAEWKIWCSFFGKIKLESDVCRKISVHIHRIFLKCQMISNFKNVNSREKMPV